MVWWGGAIWTIYRESPGFQFWCLPLVICKEIYLEAKTDNVRAYNLELITQIIKKGNQVKTQSNTWGCVLYYYDYIRLMAKANDYNLRGKIFGYNKYIKE